MKKTIAAAAIVAATLVLTDTQLFIIAAIATIATQGLRWIVQAILKEKVSGRWVMLFVFLVSLGLSVYWGGIAFPALPIFAGMNIVDMIVAAFLWLGALYEAAYAVLLNAIVVYEVLAKEILEKAGDLIEGAFSVKITYA